MMRRVLRQPEERDGPQEVELRKFYKESPEAFMKQVVALEKVYGEQRTAKKAQQSSVQSVSSPSTEGEDEGYERSVRLLREELADLRRGVEVGDEQGGPG
jgi:hypothetical protein